MLMRPPIIADTDANDNILLETYLVVPKSTKSALLHQTFRGHDTWDSQERGREEWREREGASASARIPPGVHSLSHGFPPLSQPSKGEVEARGMVDISYGRSGSMNTAPQVVTAGGRCVAGDVAAVPSYVKLS